MLTAGFVKLSESSPLLPPFLNGENQREEANVDVILSFLFVLFVIFVGFMVFM